MIPILWVEKWREEEIKSRSCVQDVKKSQSQDFFAATPSLASLRLMLAICDNLKLDIQTSDLTNAFVHADMNEAEYCEVPEEDREEAMREQPDTADNLKRHEPNPTLERTRTHELA